MPGPPNQSHAQADERQPLLSQSQSQSQSQPPADYDSVPARSRQTHPPHDRSRRSPYLSFSLRLGFFLGLTILLVSSSLIILLLINLFIPIPNLLPPHRSPALLPIWFALTTLTVIGPGLLLFELSSKVTQAIHFSVLFLDLIALLLLCLVEPLRITYAWLGITALSLSVLSAFWALATSRILAKVTIPYTINPDHGLPIVTRISSQQAQSKWKRRFKLLLAVIGTLAIASVSFLLTTNLALEALDTGFKPYGNLTLVHVKTPLGRDSPPSAIPAAPATDTRFRIHLACDEAPSHPGHDQSFLKKNATRPLRPTALVMTERGVSGIIGADWVRQMVSRAGQPSDHAGNDGHLALEKVCFWDRLGYGHTEFVGQPFAIDLQTKALHQALTQSGQIRQTEHTAKKRNQSQELGQFMIISTGFGNLFALDFAARYPELVHSFIFIDADTPESWYGDVVGMRSGLRAGYLAPGHGLLGKLWSDLLPALVEPLGISRFIGIARGKSVVDRILAPGFRGGAKEKDPGGGGWRIRGAGGANPRLLVASWYERLDANLGNSSANYRMLSQNASKIRQILSKRPVSVISSFWKMHADLEGWGAQQREQLVKPAKDAGTLIGWWRVGDRKSAERGGDQGGPAGICSTPMGSIFCQEAVRKTLAAGDTWNMTTTTTSNNFL